MKFYDDKTILSKKEIKLIKSKAKELRKICYGFGFFSFEDMSGYIGHEKKENELINFTYDQVVDSLREVLPFVEKYRENLVEDEHIYGFLTKIEKLIHNVKVSVLAPQISVEDICIEMNFAFDCYEVAYAFAKFCGGRATVCKVYDYLKEHEHGD